MSDIPDIVAMMRVEVIKVLPFGPDVTEAVLQHLATVPYRGDDAAYLVEAGHAIKLAAKRAVQPLIDQLEAEAAVAKARADTLEAQMKVAHREFEEFRRMATPSTIQ
jgi:hypothetical protein